MHKVFTRQVVAGGYSSNTYEIIPSKDVGVIPYIIHKTSRENQGKYVLNVFDGWYRARICLYINV